MILAAPLVIPFAKAVGLSVGTLGMAALADQVNEYIQANPEESMKILSTIIPGAGIGQIFMSKEDKISLEDLDEMTDEEAQDLSKEEKAELMKQAGKSGGPNKRQTMIDISEKLGLSGPGKEKQDIEYDIDERYDEGGVEEKKAPFDYTKFFRKRRADGGAIGIEVLFTEKKPRKDFSIGGRVGYQTGGQAYDPRASIQDYADAVTKVSAGTTGEKLRNIGNYVTNQLGLTQRHFDMVNKMQADPKKYGINTQFDYAKQSGKDLVKGGSKLLQPFLALGQGIASPIYDYYQALQKYSDKGYQGDFELSKKGMIDFGKNLLRVGEEYAAQKPIVMAAGRTLGGLEAANEGLLQLFQNPGAAMAQAQQSKYPDYLTAARQSEFYKNNPSALDSDLFRAAYARALPNSGIQTKILPGGQIYTDYGNYDPSRVYSAYMSDRGTSSSNPFFDQFKGSQYAEMPAIMKAMYGAPGNLNPYYADGGRVGFDLGGLTGPAKSIYDYMMAAGYFTEDEIRNAIINAGYEIPGTTTTTTPVTNVAPNIINQDRGGEGPSEPAPTGPKTYGKTFTGMTMPDGTPIGSSGIVAGPGIIDSLKNAATDLYGLYQKFSPVGIITNFMRQRAEKQQEIQDNAIDKARKEREMQEAIAEAEKKERERAAQYGATNYGEGVGGQSYSGDAVGAPGLGFGVGATTGGPVSNKTGRGRQDYSKGGLASMFVEKR